MNYLITAFKIIIIEYLILFFHELVHYISALFLGFKTSNYYLIPFNLEKNKSKLKLKILLFKDNFITSKIHFNSISISSKLQYNILLKKIRFFFFIGPIFDFIIFVALFSIGVTKIEYSYLALIALIHFSLSTINFFNSDGKYAIGAKEDTRIAFDVVRNYTLCGNGEVSHASKRILTDFHMEISENITIDTFDVNDLWNFLNNLSFYTNSLLSYLNNDILTLHSSTSTFFESIIKDYDNIKVYDYRQVEKTSLSILYYFIYLKILNKDLTINDNILQKIYDGLKIPYYNKLYNLYFNNEIENISYLRNENNMPPSVSSCEGYRKLLLNLINLYNN
ncbi:hypothetical protein [uncultured Clostridium sp.]|uniref:hypothetical protein n=1 Tax=uncultured Clostridium sp. TaxID=59620 RepID=UPI0025872F7E|nr:hypothetical protein [uncultured Clostridium sp.]